MTNFGVVMFPAEFAIHPAELARAAEERGFESLFFPEHSHIPASRKSPYPAGGELTKEYWLSHEPFVALAAAAAVTTRLKLGTAVCLVVERDPIMLAKEVASLDKLSNGRVVLGIGAGWNAEEMENHGVPFKRRWKVVREKVLAMREIWTKDAAEFHGEFVNFDPIWCGPKPVQKGGPPILLGSFSKRAFERVTEYCDGWLPVNIPNFDFARAVTSLRETVERAGRSPASIQLTIPGVAPKEEEARKFMAIGFDRILFGLSPAGRDIVMPLLDRYASLVATLARG
jgi:probable F420-dependent oxidoreductase